MLRGGGSQGVDQSWGTPPQSPSAYLKGQELKSWFALLHEVTAGHARLLSPSSGTNGVGGSSEDHMTPCWSHSLTLVSPSHAGLTLSRWSHPLTLVYSLMRLVSPASYLPALASDFLRRRLFYGSLTAPRSLTQHFLGVGLLSDFCKGNWLMTN